MNPLQRLRELARQLWAPAKPITQEEKDFMKKGPAPQHRPKARSAWLR